MRVQMICTTYRVEVEFMAQSTTLNREWIILSFLLDDSKRKVSGEGQEAGAARY